MSAAHGARLASVLDRFASLHPQEIDLGLSRIERLLARLGNPHRHLPPAVHVAGTNGKGSVIAMLGAMAQAQGLRAHMHTSPHLHHLRERFVLGGAGPMDEEALADLLEEVEAANRGAAATQYELLTAAMFLAFARAPADLALIEVGLGGEFDATNVLEDPALCLITPIAHDHADYLGDDLAGIARAKAGIIKPGAPVISARQPGPARAVLERAAHRAKAALRFTAEDFHVRSENGRLVYEDEMRLLDLPLPRLAGAHQVHNAGLAVAAALALGWPRDAIAAGLEQVRWPGRLQVLARGVLARQAQQAGAQIIVDGAHNPHAAQALAQTLADMQARDPRPLVLLAGLQQTKDATGFFAAFCGLGARIICVPVPGAPHPMSPPALQAAAQAAGLECTMAATVPLALQSVLRASGGARLCVCGSLYLAAAVLAVNESGP